MSAEELKDRTPAGTKYHHQGFSRTYNQVNVPRRYVAGQRRFSIYRNPFDVTIPQTTIRKRITGLPAFTTLKGGAYSFLPAITALRYLAAVS
jgi:hypothetical protein